MHATVFAAMMALALASLAPATSAADCYDGSFVETSGYVRCQVVCQVELAKAIVETLTFAPPAWPCPS